MTMNFDAKSDKSPRIRNKFISADLRIPSVYSGSLYLLSERNSACEREGGSEVELKGRNGRNLSERYLVNFGLSSFVMVVRRYCC